MINELRQIARWMITVEARSIVAMRFRRLRNMGSMSQHVRMPVLDMLGRFAFQV